MLGLLIELFGTVVLYEVCSQMECPLSKPRLNLLCGSLTAVGAIAKDARVEHRRSDHIAVLEVVPGFQNTHSCLCARI